MICKGGYKAVRRGKKAVMEERGGHANGKLCCRKTNIESASRLRATVWFVVAGNGDGWCLLFIPCPSFDAKNRSCQRIYIYVHVLRLRPPIPTPVTIKFCPNPYFCVIASTLHTYRKLAAFFFSDLEKRFTQTEIDLSSRRKEDCTNGYKCEPSIKNISL